MIENMVHREFVKYLVQKNIFCPITGKVLDIRTCYAILDADGDPMFVVAPSAGEEIERLISEGKPALKPGYSIVKASNI